MEPLLSGLPACSEVTKTVGVIENVRAYEAVAHHDHTPVFGEPWCQAPAPDLLLDFRHEVSAQV
jgi:hypothetical protein